ncbi:MAG: hypothetical protein RR304_01880, partial [Bacteroides sp.]
SPPGFSCQAFSKSVIAVQVRTVRPMCTTEFFMAFLGFPSNCPESLEPFIRDLLNPHSALIPVFLSYLCRQSL